MTLLELSQEYLLSAASIRQRLQELGAEIKETEDQHACIALESRVRVLRAMFRESNELAALTAHYYERGYRRNEKYTL